MNRLLIIGVALFALFALAFTLTAAESRKAPKPSPAEAPALKNFPDLKIIKYGFLNDKGLLVYVKNDGKAASKPCQLELTVRKIGNTAVGLTMYQTVPVIQPGKHVLVKLDAAGILPKNVSLEDTTFKLIVDFKKSVLELNENNNETWHNL